MKFGWWYVQYVFTYEPMKAFGAWEAENRTKIIPGKKYEKRRYSKDSQNETRSVAGFFNGLISCDRPSFSS